MVTLSNDTLSSVSENIGRNAISISLIENFSTSVLFSFHLIHTCDHFWIYEFNNKKFLQIFAVLLQSCFWNFFLLSRHHHVSIQGVVCRIGLKTFVLMTFENFAFATTNISTDIFLNRTTVYCLIVAK